MCMLHHGMKTTAACHVDLAGIKVTCKHCHNSMPGRFNLDFIARIDQLTYLFSQKKLFRNKKSHFTHGNMHNCSSFKKCSVVVTVRYIKIAFTASDPIVVKLTVWACVPLLNHWIHHSKITKQIHVFPCIDAIFNLIQVQDTAMRYARNYSWWSLWRKFRYQTGCKLEICSLQMCFSCLAQKSGCWDFS